MSHVKQCEAVTIPVTDFCNSAGYKWDSGKDYNRYTKWGSNPGICEIRSWDLYCQASQTTKAKSYDYSLECGWRNCWYDSWSIKQCKSKVHWESGDITVTEHLSPAALDQKVSIKQCYSTSYDLSKMFVSKEDGYNLSWDNDDYDNRGNDWAYYSSDRIHYAPTANNSGSPYVTIRSHDGCKYSDYANLTIKIEKNNAPIFQQQQTHTMSQCASGVSAKFSATDIEKETLTYIYSSENAGLTYNHQKNGVIRWVTDSVDFSSSGNINIAPTVFVPVGDYIVKASVNDIVEGKNCNTTDGGVVAIEITNCPFEGEDDWASYNQYPRIAFPAQSGDRHYVQIVGFGPGSVYNLGFTREQCFDLAEIIDPLWFTYYAGDWTSQDKYPRYIADIDYSGPGDLVGIGDDGVYTLYALNATEDTDAHQAGFNWEESFKGPFDLGFSYQDGWTSQDKYPRFVVDISGNGFADIIGFGDSGVYISYRDNDRMEKGWGDKQYYDIGFGYSEQSWSSQNEYPRLMGDVNGDGKADIVGFHKDKIYVAYLEPGWTADKKLQESNYFVYNSGWTNMEETPRFLADIDGDGKVDIVGIKEDLIYIAKSNGVEFDLENILILDTSFRLAEDDWSNYDKNPLTFVDVNGDGKDDILSFGANNKIYTYFSVGDNFTTINYELCSASDNNVPYGEDFTVLLSDKKLIDFASHIGDEEDSQDNLWVIITALPEFGELKRGEHDVIVNDAYSANSLEYIPNATKCKEIYNDSFKYKVADTIITFSSVHTVNIEVEKFCFGVGEFFMGMGAGLVVGGVSTWVTCAYGVDCYKNERETGKNIATIEISDVDNQRKEDIPEEVTELMMKKGTKPVLQLSNKDDNANDDHPIVGISEVSFPYWDFTMGVSAGLVVGGVSTWATCAYGVDCYKYYEPEEDYFDSGQDNNDDGSKVDIEF